MAATATTVPRRSWTHKQHYAAYMFVVPSLLFLLVFVVYPIFGALYFSFHRYTLLEPPVWLGIDHYVNLLDDKRFLKAIGNTFMFALMTVPVGTALALLLALAIDRPLRGITFFRTTYYLPVVTSFVAVSFIWLWIYEPQFGVLNDLLEMVGLPRLYWLRDPGTALLSIAGCAAGNAVSGTGMNPKRIHTRSRPCGRANAVSAPRAAAWSRVAVRSCVAMSRGSCPWPSITTSGPWRRTARPARSTSTAPSGAPPAAGTAPQPNATSDSSGRGTAAKSKSGWACVASARGRSSRSCQDRDRVASASDALPLRWLNSSVAPSVTLTRSSSAAANRS